MRAQNSQLLIPPSYEERQPEVGTVETDQKYIGLFSSGTTGRPKCIWNSYDNLWQNGIYTADAFDIKPTDKLLMLAEPWHVAGFTWMLMAEFLECEYQFITTKKGAHKEWLKAIREFEPDYLMTVPAVLRGIYDESWQVENVVYGGYPIKHSEYQLLARHCSTMYQGYGQTEAGGLISVHKRKSSNTPEDLEHLCGGLPIEGVQLQSEGTPKQPAPILITSETAFTDKTYISGDLGFIDNTYRVFITGRADKD